MGNAQNRERVSSPTGRSSGDGRRRHSGPNDGCTVTVPPQRGLLPSSTPPPIRGYLTSAPPADQYALQQQLQLQRRQQRRQESRRKKDAGTAAAAGGGDAVFVPPAAARGGAEGGESDKVRAAAAVGADEQLAAAAAAAAATAGRQTVSRSPDNSRTDHTSEQQQQEEEEDGVWQLSDPTKPSTERLPLVIQWRVPGCQQVLLSGSFNLWRPIPMQYCHTKGEEEFMVIVNLPVGEHEYVFLVDGRWMVDGEQSMRDSQVTGDQVNYVLVQPVDFRAVEAMDQDWATGRDDDHSPPGSYGQLFPTGALPLRGRPLAPPELPPYLSTVILNQNTPHVYEPTLLPEPKHVMLNHLYALSIRDGVMVVSATHRYRKKFVTTVLYKPI